MWGHNVLNMRQSAAIPTACGLMLCVIGRGRARFFQSAAFPSTASMAPTVISTIPPFRRGPIEMCTRTTHPTHSFRLLYALFTCCRYFSPVAAFFWLFPYSLFQFVQTRLASSEIGPRTVHNLFPCRNTATVDEVQKHVHK